MMTTKRKNNKYLTQEYVKKGDTVQKQRRVDLAYAAIDNICGEQGHWPNTTLELMEKYADERVAELQEKYDKLMKQVFKQSEQIRLLKSLIDNGKTNSGSNKGHAFNQ